MDSGVQVDQTDLERAPRLRSVIAKLARLLRRTDSSSGVELTPTRVAVLFGSDRHGPLRLAELGEREGLNPTLLSRTVATLVADGLIERRPDPKDRRSAWVQSTPAGHAAAQRIRRERTAALHTAIAQLDERERTLIDAALPALERIAQALADAGR